MAITFEIRPKGDGSVAKIDLIKDGKNIASEELTAADFDTMILGMAAARARLKPEVSREFPLGQRFAAEYDPRWYTEAEKLSEGSTLLLRHPGLGWLAFLFPREEARKIRDYLSKQVDLPQSDKSKPN